MTTLNAAFYLFADLSPLEPLRDQLRARCEELGLLGTILLAQEGINGMLAGPEEAVRAAIATIQTSRPALAQLLPKLSISEGPSFKHLDVKIKPEIVTMRVPGVDANRTAPRLAPETLRDWLRAGEDVVLIDVRNDFEYKLGTFTGALNPGTTAFHEFPDFVRERLESLRDKRVVTFCTGGIRCEKATSWMLDQGFTDLYQLDGGILNYFARVEDADRDWHGRLFVFDQRQTVDTKIAPHPLDEPPSDDQT